MALCIQTICETFMPLRVSELFEVSHIFCGMELFLFDLYSVFTLCVESIHFSNGVDFQQMGFRMGNVVRLQVCVDFWIGLLFMFQGVELKGFHYNFDAFNHHRTWNP